MNYRLTLTIGNKTDSFVHEDINKAIEAFYYIFSMRNDLLNDYRRNNYDNLDNFEVEVSSIEDEGSSLNLHYIN